MVVTEWNEFRALDLQALKDRMRGDVLVDLRNIYLPAQARAAGFSFSCIGQRIEGTANTWMLDLSVPERRRA